MKMEWISVENKLPEEKEEEHLVTDGDKVCACDYIFWSCFDEPLWDWLKPKGMKSITHWMPLPEPPKD